MIKIVKAVFIIIIFLLVGSYTAHLMFFNNEKAQQTDKLVSNNDSLRFQIDSLKQEISVMELQLHRYEYVIETAREEMRPECVEELERIFSETE